MKRLYKNILLFILPVALAIFFIPMNTRLKYIGLRNECFDHAILLYDRSHNNPEPVDIAFFGSSRTINGIDDTLIQNKFNNRKHVFNFGYCTLGQNIYYTLLKTVLEGKKIETVVLEVREEEDRYSHNMFPFIADTKDVLGSPLLFNRDYFVDIENHFLYKIELFQDITFGRIKQSLHRMENYGYATGANKADTAFLNSIKQANNVPVKELIELETNFHMKYPRSYLAKLSEMCKEKKVKIIFLYLPSYGYYAKPKEYDTYIKYGKVILPPREILDKKENWSDEQHLNITGASELSIWLVNHLL